DPSALKSFLAYAVHSWTTPPRYVALAGKGSYDYRNLLGLGSNLLPPLLLSTPQGLAPADAEYADFDGSGVPALAVGRIPAGSAVGRLAGARGADLRAYVDKLAAYERAPGGAWTGRALPVADDADAGGDFPAGSEALARTLPSGLALSRVYLPSAPSPAQLQA